MNKKIFVVVMLLAMTFFWIPADSSAVSAQERRTRVRQDRNTGGRQVQRGHRSKSWDRGRKKNANGYRNYGQYRRTQVGSRRFRVVRQPYYRNGVRLTRLVRVYY